MHRLPTRNDAWLDDRFKMLWKAYYADARVGLPIEVRFGRPAQYRFGSIRQKGDHCLILINPLFALPNVPEYVIDATMVHELAHYVHGYGSGLSKLHAHPHRGGVIDRELEKRGCSHLEELSSEWRRRNWASHYQTNHASALSRKAKRTEEVAERWHAYLSLPGMRRMAEIDAVRTQLAERLRVPAQAFTLDWLYPSRRKTGVSYWHRSEGVVRLHPLLADPKVPVEVIQYELLYWLALHRVGRSWVRIQKEIASAGLQEVARKAMSWRHQSWGKMLRGHQVS